LLDFFWHCLVESLQAWFPLLSLLVKNHLNHYGVF